MMPVTKSDWEKLFPEKKMIAKKNYSMLDFWNLPIIPLFTPILFQFYSNYYQKNNNHHFGSFEKGLVCTPTVLLHWSHPKCPAKFVSWLERARNHIFLFFNSKCKIQVCKNFSRGISHYLRL